MAVLVTCGTCQREFRAKDQARGVKLKCPGCGTALTVDGPRVANHEVFLSYSHKDKSVADAVCAALENRKIRCWMAPRDIAPGGDWSASIITAIEDARIMVLIFSSSSNMSQQVLREVERAVSKGLIVLPFRIESVDLSKSMEYFLSACDWMDALTSPFDEHLKALTTQVKLMLLGGEAGETKPLGADLSRNIQGKIRGPQPRKPLMTLAAAAVVCLFIAGGLFAWHLSRGVRFPNRESESSVLPTTAPVAQASIPPPAIAADTPVRETATTKPEETVAADISKGLGMINQTPESISSPNGQAVDPVNSATRSQDQVARAPQANSSSVAHMLQPYLDNEASLPTGWTIAGSDLQAGNNAHPIKLESHEIGPYELHVAFTPTDAKMGCRVNFVYKKFRCWYLLHSGGPGNGFAHEPNRWSRAHTPLPDHPAINVGQRYDLVIRVLDGEADALLDGEVLQRWNLHNEKSPSIDITAAVAPGGLTFVLKGPGKVHSIDLNMIGER